MNLRIAMIIGLIICSLLFMHFGCASSQNLNDFFGIEMPEDEADNFKIVSYEQKRGANYYSNVRMNTQLYAWAEIQPQIINFKVVNMTETDVPTNYNLDQFVLVTESGEEFFMILPDRLNYPATDLIASHKSVDYSLEIPTRFWQTHEITGVAEADPDSYQLFWKGENSLQIIKEKIKMIKIKLGGEITIIMKPIP